MDSPRPKSHAPFRSSISVLSSPLTLRNRHAGRCSPYRRGWQSCYSLANVLPLRSGGPIEDALAGEVELLYLTAEVRHDRPSVLDEVSTVLWYLETRLLDASEQAHSALVRAFTDEFGQHDAHETLLTLAVPLRIGNWVGGDRDGNPFVTPDITLAAARRASYAILGRYRETLSTLIERLSLSAHIRPPSDALRASLDRDREQLPDVWEANRRRNADEPVRLKLTFMAARIDATRRLVAAHDAGSYSMNLLRIAALKRVIRISY